MAKHLLNQLVVNYMCQGHESKSKGNHSIKLGSTMQ
jgi:hypothetical protein